MAIDVWEGYWRHAGHGAAHHVGGAHESVLVAFWNQVLASLASRRATLRILDVACGNGAVLGYLLGAAAARGAPEIRAVGVDGSVSALADLRRRRPEIAVLAADIARIPFKDGAFDLVTSQFGIEYGGPSALAEVSRVVGPGGVVAALLHRKDGGIHRECAANLRVIDAMVNMLPPARAAFQAGFDLRDKRVGRPVFDRAARLLVAAAADVKTVLDSGEQNVAAGLIRRLFDDIGHIYRGLPRYDEAEVMEWLVRMEGEVRGYRGRMAAMVDAALDAAQFGAFARMLAQCGMRVHEREPLRFGSAGDVAWVLVADRLVDDRHREDVQA